MPQLDLDPVALRTFVAVATTGSFTQAAAAVGYTQSAVSRQMAALESSCSAELFTRGARGVRLTPAGEYLLPYARSMLEHLDEAARALDAVRNVNAGVLRIGAFSTATTALVPAAINRFRRQHQGVELILREGFTGRLLPMLAAGDLDIAIVSTHVHPTLAAPGVEFLPLLEDPLHIALPGTHRLAGQQQIPLVELAGEQWIVADTAEAIAALESTCAVAGFRPTMSLRVAEWSSKLALVEAGVGITLVPSIAADAMRREGVVLRALAPDPPTRSVHVAVARHARRAPAVTEFVRQLQAVVADTAVG